MSLKDLNIKKFYDSDTDDILNSFYIPVLSVSTKYQRLAGFFSSSSLAVASRGIAGLICNKGKIELVCGAKLKKDDVEAIVEGSKKRIEVIEKSMLEDLGDIEKLQDELVSNHVRALGWMVANNLLEIKVAIVTDLNKKPLDHIEVSQLGIFHQKVGILQDKEGNTISFSGSVNETRRAWTKNVEEIKIFRSWIEAEYEHFKSDYDKFNRYWNGETDRAEIFEIPKALKEKLIEIAPRDIDELNLEYEPKSIEKPPTISCPIELRKYQKEAIEQWFENKGKGILKMATGTGKTITALALVSNLYKKCGEKLSIIIACPYKHLVAQWKNVAKSFNLNPILAFESHERWENLLNSKITSFNSDVINSFSFITTHKTFGMDIMQKTLSKLYRKDVIIIVDEVHHLGAKHLRNCLPENIPFRLGLSATPERWYDNVGNKYVNDYFKNGIIYEYGLKDAVKDGWLTRYYYYPHLIELTEDECEEYHKLSKKITKIFPKKTDFELSEHNALKSLLIMRARLIGSAKNKLKKLEELFEDRLNSKFNLVYCGDGRIEDERQIEKVISILGRKLGISTHPFTAEEEWEERKMLLRRFEKGELQALVAIRCLDEGVDVPATQTAYILASSTNPRQFIQRRGRILRRDKNKKYSYIHDFVVIPPSFNEADRLKPEQFNVERKMIMRELIRVSEFAESAENGPQVSKDLLGLKKKYNLLHL